MNTCPKCKFENDDEDCVCVNCSEGLDTMTTPSQETLLPDEKVRELAYNWELGFKANHTDDYTFNAIRKIEREILNTRATPPTDLTWKGGDVQMNKHQTDSSLNSPEQLQPSRGEHSAFCTCGECYTKTSPVDLAKAIENLENEVAVSESDGDQFSRDITTVCNYAKQVQEYQLAAGFCDKHKPNGGARNCIICACEKLSFALSRISYICGKPNETKISEYDIHFNEEEVIKQVQGLREQLNGSYQSIHKWSNKSVELAEKIAKLEQSSRDDKALIEKLVEASDEYLNIASPLGTSAFANAVIKLSDAISIAHFKDYGKKG